MNRSTNDFIQATLNADSDVTSIRSKETFDDEGNRVDTELSYSTKSGTDIIILDPPQPSTPAIKETVSRPTSEPGQLTCPPSNQPYLPLTQMQENMREETGWNNAVAGLLTSRERKEKVESRMFDAAQINFYREQLKSSPIMELPKQLEVCAEIPMTKLPASMARLINEVADHLQVPTEAVVSALIGTLFISARGNFQIKVKNGYTETLTGYMLVGMPSGGRKSAIVGFFRRVFDEVEQERQIDFDLNSPEVSISQRVLKKIVKQTETELLHELKDEAGLEPDEIAIIIAKELAPLEMKLMKASSRPRFLVDSPTMKELAMIMACQGEAIGIFEAEGGLYKHRIRPNADNIILKGHTMEPYADETSTAGSAVMRAPCLATCLFVQMDVAEKLFANTELKDHGVLPRILPIFAAWTRGVKKTHTADISEESVELYENKIRTLLDISRPEGADDERTWHTIGLSPDALDVLNGFRQDINGYLHEGSFDNFEAFGEKLAGHAIRLAGAIHLWKHEVPHDSLISNSSMDAGVELAKFYTEHAMAAFNMDRLQAIEYAKKILKWHRRVRKPEFTKQYAQNRIGRCTADQIQAGLDLLERHGFLGQYLKPRGGVICIINPNYDPNIFHL